MKSYEYIEMNVLDYAEEHNVSLLDAIQTLFEGDNEVSDALYEEFFSRYEFV